MIDFDLAPEKREEVFELCKEKYGRDRCLNILTVKTLTPKACILTVGRGLDINNDEVSAIADLVPVDRGSQWSLHDCLYGNEEKERKAIGQFKTVMKQYPNLIEMAMEIEGLETSMSSHASAFCIFQSDYVETNSLMTTPGGKHVTCWTMHESEEAGALKLDFLVTDGISKLMKSMELLIEDGIIEDQGSLRDTYNKYIHPDVINYDNQEMYDLLFKGEVIDAFQYQTPLGRQVLRKLNARSFIEIATGNSLMRLVKKHGEQPLDRYIRYKNSPNEWKDDMVNYGLDSKEIEIAKRLLSTCGGVMDTQEALMITCMDSEVANFTLKEANVIKKGLSKKKPKIIEQAKNMFYEKGLSIGTRKVFLDYVWSEQIEAQLG